MTRAFPKLSALVLALTAGAALGQMEIAPPVPVEPPASPAASLPTVIENPASTRHSPPLHSAQSVLDDLLREKSTTGPAGKSLPPPSSLAGPATTSATSTAPALEITGGVLREGQFITARSGHLAKDAAGRMQFVFDPVEGKPALPPMGIVPSRLLVALEEASDHAARPTKFTIDGQITEYRNKNYLYLTDSDAPPPGPTTNPARLPAQVAPVAPEVPEAQRLREGVSIYSRVGRLVKDEKTGIMLFDFDSDGQKMADPPLALIPCHYLAILENASEMGTRPLKFRISGEVTQYRGRNYLFLKFVQAVRDMNQGIGG